MSRILALETATTICSVALAEGDRVVAELTLEPEHNHADVVLACLDRLLQLGGWCLADLDALAVSIGPGAFTGLRTGISLAKGLALGRDLRVVAVPTLEALALAGMGHGSVPVCPLLDARKGHVYAALYRLDGAGIAETRVSPADLPPAAVLALLPAEVILLGPGLAVCADLLPTDHPAGWVALPLAIGRPRASLVALAGQRLLAAGRAVPAHALQAAYVRAPDARPAQQ